MPPHIVIIGGGFGGLSAARALRRADVRVTLVDRRNHHLFQPLLYQVATATLSPGDIAAPIRWILRHVHNVRVLMGEVQRVDVAARRVVLADGAVIDYDGLIVATGASTRTSGTPTGSPMPRASRRSRTRSRSGAASCWPSSVPSARRTPPASASS